MKVETIVTVIAAVSAVVALYYNRRSTQESAAQTRIQRQLQIDASQPYVWADMRPNVEHGQFLELVVGNSGPTVARHVVVTISPPLDPMPGLRDTALTGQQQLAEGLSSLPPGRTMLWNMGTPWELVPTGSLPHTYTFRIECDGPFGPVPLLDYSVRPLDLLHQKRAASGTLDGVTSAINKLTDGLTKTIRESAQGPSGDFD